MPGDDERRAAVAADRARVAPRRRCSRSPSEIRTALGDEGEAADRAITDIAGQMQAFNASDVAVRHPREPVHQGRARRRRGRRADDRDVAVPAARSRGSRRRTWPASSASSSPPARHGDGAPAEEPTGPGLHGTGLDATSATATSRCRRGASNRLTYVKGQPFTVVVHQPGRQRRVRRQGHAEDRSASGRLADHAQQDRPADRQGREGDGRRCRSTASRRSDAVVTINVTVAAVPGEKKTDNNKSTYPSLFVRASG